MSKATEIAATIIQQMGGNMFRMMTGAKDFVALNETENQAGGVQFGIGKNAKGINKVVVRLTWMDTYEVDFLKIRKMEVKKIVEAKDVYCDTLRPLFEDATGMYTSL